jgi:hypothetical protein
MMTVLRKRLINLIILGCWLSSISVQALATPPGPGIVLRPTVVQTKDGLTLDWHVSASLVQISSRADGTINVALPGASQTDQPGLPELPFVSVLIAVPPDATPTLRVPVTEEQTIPLPAHKKLKLAPAPSGVQRDASGRVIGGALAPSSTTISSSMEQVVTLESVGVMRGVRLARVTFYPVRPVDGQPYIRVATHLSASVAFNTSTYRIPLPIAELDPLQAAVRSAVVNPDQVMLASRSLPLAQRATAGENESWAIEVSAPGLTAITYEALSGNGFPVDSADPHNLYLARAGTEIAVEWDGDGDTSFEPGERLLFYAEPRFSRWTYSDVYFLWQDTTPGLRMSSRSAAPTGQPGIAWADATAEVNALYTPDCFCGSVPAGRDGDHWAWDILRLPDRTSGLYPIKLPSAVDATQPATLTVWLIGYTDVTADPDHHVDVRLNNALLGSVEWNGKQAITTTLPVTPSILHGGVNTVTLTLPGIVGVNVEGTWLDAFSVHYARGNAPSGSSALLTGQPVSSTYTVAFSSTAGLRAYDVTDSDHPLRLTGIVTDSDAISWSDPVEGGIHRYAITSADGILSPAQVRPAENPWGFHATGGFTGADYIIITHPAFADALSPLVSLRQSQGLTTTVVNVLGIYDEYGDGRPEPEAIRAFIVNAYTSWMLRPTYVLLVGDGSFDPKRYRADSPPTFIPPYLANVDPWAGETAADNRYVTADGADDLPDLLIGRLPVKTLTETQTVVDKIVQYETAPFPGGWNGNVTFVADDADPGAGDFPAQSEIIATTFVTLPFTAQRIYFTPPTTTITATRQDTLNAWNTGALLMQFAGHSSWQQWAEERFFHLDDLPTLHNDRRWPIVIEMTCFTGAFHRPEPTLDKELLNLKDAGAVAVWSSTALGLSAGHDKLDEGFFQAVFNDQVNTLGQAALSGKLSLAGSGQQLYLLDTFTLLGDPAMRFDRTIVPWTSQVFLPLASK